MTKAILATKGNMSLKYDQRGQRVAITVLNAQPNTVAAIKEDKALLGLGSKKKVKKPENSFVDKIGFAPKFKREVKKEGEIKIGDKITVAVFSPGDEVKVTGITKGRGFAGGMKRWGFHGGPKTHGQSDRHRAPGSIGQGTTPGRVLKGKKMAGHYGNKQKTITGLEIIEVDIDNNQILVKGAVPGAKEGYLVVEKTGKVKGYTPPPQENENKKPEEEAQANPQENKQNEQKPTEEKPKENKQQKEEPKE